MFFEFFWIWVRNRIEMMRKLSDFFEITQKTQGSERGEKRFMVKQLKN